MRKRRSSATFAPNWGDEDRSPVERLHPVGFAQGRVIVRRKAGRREIAFEVLVRIGEVEDGPSADRLREGVGRGVGRGVAAALVVDGIAASVCQAGSIPVLARLRNVAKIESDA